MVVRLILLLVVFLVSPISVSHAIPEGPAYPSLGWLLRETSNFTKSTESTREQALNLQFQTRVLEQGALNELDWLERTLVDPSWIDPLTGNTAATPLCSLGLSPICVGDPFRYPEAQGADGDRFYEGEAEVIPVVFYDRDCARISGHVWAPKDSMPGDSLPGIVIENGSLQAPEQIWWWAAQALVRSGYIVMTFDPRSHGRSDMLTPEGELGSNLNPYVFVDNLVDAIDFFRSNEEQPYPHSQACEGSYPTKLLSQNPFADRLDLNRLGIAGHSLGAQSVMEVQSFDAPGADPWPGALDESNPVDVAVAWDSGSNPHLLSGGTSTPLVHDLAVALVAFPVTLNPRVPLMSQQSEYGLVPTAFLSPGKPDSHKADYAAWSAQQIPVFQFTIRGSTHYEWSPTSTLPSTSWCPAVKDGRCVGGFGRPLAEHYSVAWFDRWLKQRGESGYCDADARLLADASWRDRYSFYFRSARRFPDRQKTLHQCTDIRAGCQDTVVRPACP